MRQVDLDSQKIKILLGQVQKPARYVGGEYGSINRVPLESDFAICVAFPDLYEIGMSNHALRIIYNILNDTDGLHAERVFSPAEDFRVGLKNAGVNLYSLENGFEVRDFDVLAITIGYELLMTNVFEILDTSNIPIKSVDREEDDPIVISGGPSMTNPAPWGDFMDAVFIGESEGILSDTMLDLKQSKDSGCSRQDLIQKIGDTPGFWTSTAPMAVRQVWMGFSSDKKNNAFPIPSMKTVQDHGVIEVMRGCPNKCRFCHAGIFYRPFRQKPLENIVEQAKYLVQNCGYREITLSSLSSGDYANLEPLVHILNHHFSAQKISFNLPSLRVNSFSLQILTDISTIRKSGLTFAVETPGVKGQKALNKNVNAHKVTEILLEAKKHGWKKAKLYFMLGLPYPGSQKDESDIPEYLEKIQKDTGMQLNVNLGTFIPKPHTPYERAEQLTDDEAMRRILLIRETLRKNRHIKFSFHSPFASFIEGIISRGDRKAGQLALQAWKRGARFDAWDDIMDKEAWRNAINKSDWNVSDLTCQQKSSDMILAWNGVKMRISEAYKSTEKSLSDRYQTTEACTLNCEKHCGVCSKDCGIVIPEDEQKALNYKKKSDKSYVIKKLMLFFSKTGRALYLGHLDVMGVMERSFQRAGLSIAFCGRYNPRPKLEFAQPLPLGVRSKAEICTVVLNVANENPPDNLRECINTFLPDGFQINNARWIPMYREDGRKTPGIMSIFWGSQWEISLRTDYDWNAQQLERFWKVGTALREQACIKGISDDIQIDIDSDIWKITLESKNTKNHNFKRLLESAIGQCPIKSGWDITRTACLAKESGGGDAISYEDFFDSFQ